MSEIARKSEIILYQTEDGQTKLQVKIEGETVWLTQDQMAELFEKGGQLLLSIYKIRLKRASLMKMQYVGNSDELELTAKNTP